MKVVILTHRVLAARSTVRLSECLAVGKSFSLVLWSLVVVIVVVVVVVVVVVLVVLVVFIYFEQETQQTVSLLQECLLEERERKEEND